MSNAIQDIYAQVVSPLSPTERLQLATLILNDLVQQKATAIDDSDTWTEQDQIDVVAFSMQYAENAFSEDEALIT
ncbi:MAG: hypothetical protein AAFQ95_15370 [Cyanobacteria bacterium J06621_3]